MKFYLYILKTLSDTLYTGIAIDVKKRFELHKSKKGAKYTSIFGVQEILYLDIFENKSLALKEEYRIKKTLNRAQKLDLIEKNSAKTQKLLKLKTS